MNGIDFKQIQEELARLEACSGVSIPIQLFLRSIDVEAAKRVAELKEAFPDPVPPVPQRLNRKQRRAARAKERRS